MSTCPGPGTGRGTSLICSTEIGPGVSQTTAFIVVGKSDDILVEIAMRDARIWMLMD